MGYPSSTKTENTLPQFKKIQNLMKGLQTMTSYRYVKTMREPSGSELLKEVSTAGIRSTNCGTKGLFQKI
jgi:hypothetical protein